MSESMGQSVVVENRGGAGGSLGADVAAKAPPDGYTILMHNITFPMASVSLTLAGRKPYNIETDFAAISNVVNVPLVMTAHPSVPAKDLRELVAMLSTNRSLQYNYGSTAAAQGFFVTRAKRNLDAAAFAEVQARVRTRVLRTFVKRGLIDKDDASEMRAWAHGCGFPVDGSVRIEGAERIRLERLLRYCAQPGKAGNCHVGSFSDEYGLFHSPNSVRRRARDCKVDCDAPDCSARLNRRSGDQTCRPTDMCRFAAGEKFDVA